MSTRLSIRLLILLAGIATATAAGASPMTLIASPQETGGSFRHNLFHSADSSGGAAGTIKAWIDLDATFGTSNFYDPDTGDLEAHFDVFTSSSLGTQVGTATLTSSTVDGTVLGDGSQSGSLVGTLTWEIDLSSSASGALYDYLVAEYGAEGDDIWDLEMKFADVFYSTSTNGQTANSWDSPYLTLWAAGASNPGDLVFSGSSKTGGSGGVGGFGSTADLGLDLVLQVVPEPASGLLFGMGLGGLSVAGRRRRNRAIL